MTTKSIAIAREAGSAAEHIGIGVTALGKAIYAFPAYYSQAFFALSLGLERSCKLALAVHYALHNGGNFPSEKTLRAYGHEIHRLLETCDELSKTEYPNVSRIPDTFIHRNIVAILSDFASNITRYYNLQVITEHPHINSIADPLRQWHERVVQPILEEKCNPESIKRVMARAELFDQFASPLVLVRHTAENGNPLNTVFEASAQTGLTSLSTPYVRLHVLQIVRPIAQLLAELGHQAQATNLEDIPYLREFYSLFLADDAYFKSHKVWSTYPKYPAS